MSVARNAAATVYSYAEDGDYSAARNAFLLMQMIGLALAGGLAAVLAFDRTRSFWTNVKWRLAPIAAVIFLPSLMQMASAADYSLAFGASRIGFGALSVLAGAWLDAKLKGR